MVAGNTAVLMVGSQARMHTQDVTAFLTVTCLYGFCSLRKWVVEECWGVRFFDEGGE